MDTFDNLVHKHDKVLSVGKQPQKSPPLDDIVVAKQRGSTRRNPPPKNVNQGLLKSPPTNFGGRERRKLPSISSSSLKMNLRLTTNSKPGIKKKIKHL